MREMAVQQRNGFWNLLARENDGRASQSRGLLLAVMLGSVLGGAMVPMFVALAVALWRFERAEL